MNVLELPPPDKLIPTIQKLLKYDGYSEIADKLSDSSCTYYPHMGMCISSKLGQDLNLVVASEYFSFFDDKKTKEIILKYANKILNNGCYYEFVYINISPELSSKFSSKLWSKLSFKSSPKSPKKVFDSDIVLINKIFTGNEKHSVPKIIIQNSKEMSLVYQYVYIIENVLRFYIDQKGNSFFKKITIPNKISQKIENRVQSDKKNIWMNSKRNSLLHFLDLMDLYILIENNWNLFENDFPSKEWIKSKVFEINECRKLIAHNNDCISSHSKETLILNSKSILKQLGYLE